MSSFHNQRSDRPRSRAAEARVARDWSLLLLLEQGVPWPLQEDQAAQSELRSSLVGTERVAAVLPSAPASSTYERIRLPRTAP